MKDLARKMRPRVAIPPRFPATAPGHAAFWIATGLGSGLLRPASGTWGSLAGLAYLYGWAIIPSHVLQFVVALLVIAIGIWSASVCERFFGEKDPSSVVIDEIVALPIGFYPLLHFHDSRPWVWVGAFCLYRLMDILKLWPARRLEALGGGVGIVVDDLASAVHTALLLFVAEAVLR